MMIGFKTLHWHKMMTMIAMVLYTRSQFGTTEIRAGFCGRMWVVLRCASGVTCGVTSAGENTAVTRLVGATAHTLRQTQAEYGHAKCDNLLHLPAQG